MTNRWVFVLGVVLLAVFALSLAPVCARPDSPSAPIVVVRATTILPAPTIAARYVGAGAEPTIAPAATAVTDEQSSLQPVRYSHYWPPLGGVNCGWWVDGECVSHMASGYRWQDWVGRAVACPTEWPFGTHILFEGTTWTCMDRGGMIRFVDGIPWVDFLTPSAAYGYGTIVQVRVIFPEEGQ